MSDVSVGTVEQFPGREDFAALLDETYGSEGNLEGSVVRGTILAVEHDFVVVDVGLKTEGRVPMKEFQVGGRAAEVKVGDEVEVYLERIENGLHEAVISRDKARREEAWAKLEKSYEVNERVEGMIFGRVKGGFTVDLSGAVAFLPGSQVDIRPIRDVTPLMGTPQPFQILKMDRRRGNIVVSRRAVLEETRAEARSELIQRLEEGMVCDGVVKNITDYGAFVDLGGIDGLLHVTDISWRRVNHPSEVLTIGETIKVQVIKVNKETQRISLGMKQLQADPFSAVASEVVEGAEITGKVTKVMDFGAFVEVAPGVEGLVHSSELDWKRVNAVTDVVQEGEVVQVKVLTVNPEDHKISLSIKQLKDRPQQSGGGGRGGRGGGRDEAVVKEETPELRRMREKAKHNRSGQKKGGGLGDAGGMGMGLGDLKF